MKTVRSLLTFVVAVLLCTGIVLLASASTVRAQGLFDDPRYFLKRQLLWMAVAIVAAIVAAYFDYHLWKKYPWLPVLLFAALMLGLLLVFVPGIGGRVKGSYRWLRVGPVGLQPGELVKFGVVILMSVWMDRIGSKVKNFKKGAFLPALGLGLLAIPLAVAQDFGATLLVIMLGFVIMFAAGTRFLHLVGLGLAGLTPVVLAIISNANRMARIQAWLSGAEGEGSAAGHQLNQAILAFKNGGPFGVGLNQSIQKYNYLPEAHTDFIFAIGGEEMGFLFSAGAVTAYALLLICGILISMRATDRFGQLLAFGVTVLLISQALFNIGVVTGCLPTKGLALPFMSYGGTNLVVTLFSVGTLINIGMHVDLCDERLHAQVARNAVNQV